MRRLIFFSILLSGFILSIQAQPISRSGNPALPEDKNLLRKFPCGGTTVLDQAFNGSSIPSGWTVLDVDGFAPHPNATLLAPMSGWQSVPDFKNPSGGNRILASPSWYENDEGPSDDWLISPLIEDLPVNTCLSWYAYSQDQDFPESYEVRISTTTSDLDSFLVRDALEEIDEEGSEFTYRSLSLAAYQGKDIYLAFRHTSDDKFILALDDIRLGKVQTLDLAMFSIESLNVPSGTEVNLSGSIINRGLAEIDLDSAELEINYSINGGEAKTYGFPRNVLLEPNDTIQFVHDTTWTPMADSVYRITFFVSEIANDGNLRNDTLSVWQGIGTATPIEDRLEALPLRAYPVPMKDELIIEFQGQAVLDRMQVRILDLFGKAVLPEEEIRSLPYRLDVSQLASGMYVLQVRDGEGRQFGQRLVKQ